MAFLTLSRKFNQWLGPFLLRHGLRARHAVLGGGGVGGAVGRDNPHLDTLLGLPLAQWLVSLEIHDETRDAIQAGRTNVGVLDFWFHPKRNNNGKGVYNNNNDDNDDESRRVVHLTLEEETEIRLHVLNKYLRPVLVGGNKNTNEHQQWSNVQIWQFHYRFIKWARREYFRAKYGSVLRATLDAFPALRQSPQLTPSSSSSSSSSASNSSSTLRPAQGMFGKLFSWNATGSKKNNAQIAAAVAAGGNNNKLPSTSLVTMALGMQDWSQHKNTSATRDSMRRVAKRLGGTILEFRGGALCIPDIPKTAQLRYALAGTTTTAASSGEEKEEEDKQAALLLTVEELLEVVGGHVASCGPLNALCEEADIYQIWTREYVQALGQYLLRRTEQFTDGETIVLDVGAGDGLLCEHLREFFQELKLSPSSLDKISSTSSPRRTSRTNQSRNSRGKRIIRQPYSLDVNKTTSSIPTVIATDNGSWKVFPRADVEMLGYHESIEKYANRDHHINDEGSIGMSKKQVIVLCSWMPMNEDWTATFRHYGVDEYILIGECDDGQCGDNWLTWGNSHFLTDPPSQQPGTNINSNGGGGGGDQQYVDSDGILGSKRLYEVDGYVRKDLIELQKFQFSRFDSSTSKYGKTVSFRRCLPTN